MKARHKRALLIATALGAIAIAAALVLTAFRGNLVFFFTPTQVAAKQVPTGRTFRIGGLVAENSLRRSANALTVHFTVTDTLRSVPVVYTGILPDLFREGKGVVAQGKLAPDGVFHAVQVLAKHDENYMPPDAAHAVEQGRLARTLLSE